MITFLILLINQWKTKTFIDLKVTTKPVKPVNQLKIAHDLILMRLPRILFMMLKAKDYDAIDVNVFHFKLMKFHFKKRPNGSLYHYFPRSRIGKTKLGNVKTQRN